jgi:hypothetical protein
MRFGKDVLKIVQHQQQAPIAERMGKAVHEWHLAHLANSHRLGDRRRYQG